MSPIFNFYSLIYSTLFTLCSAFVLLSSAAGQNRYDNEKILSPGQSLIYQWNTNILLNDNIRGGVNGKNIGFFINGEVRVSSIWKNNEKRILKFELKSPKLHVKSRKTPNPNGFIAHKSKLERLKNKPFLVIWENGLINEIYVSKDESLTMINMKKGLASLFEIQNNQVESIESDTAGQCQTIYTTTSNSQQFTKTKINCNSLIDNTEHDPQHVQDNILGININSSRTINYEFDPLENIFKKFHANELHRITANAKEELGGSVQSDQHLIHLKTEQNNKLIIIKDDLKDVISKVELDDGVIFMKESLFSQKESYDNDQPVKISKQVQLLKEELKSQYLGNVKSAQAFLKLLEVTRNSNSEEISKVLSAKKYKSILPQLYDILGHAQTEHCHKAVMKHLHLDDEKQTDLIERYLWALSLSNQPNIVIIEDLLNKYKKYTNIPNKVNDTLILTLASMSRKLNKFKFNGITKIQHSIKEAILNGLDYAQGTNRYIFFKALKNLQDPSTLSTLSAFLKNGTLKEEVLAWNAIKSFGSKSWNSEILKQAEKALFELDRKHDSSSRTIAADILINSERINDDAVLISLLDFVASNHTVYEIKQYVFQRIRMLMGKDTTFNERVLKIIKNRPKLNNYSALSPRGLSTALLRSMYQSTSSNGSLISIQEIKSGIVKKGAVDVVLEKNDDFKDIFTLGIFTSGLESYVTTVEDDSDENEEDSATAGMELTILGTQIRPFVFFDGQGELMGHLWSGTASDITPAFQALILWQDYNNEIHLSNGFIINLNFKGAISFDLSGKVSVSLWNKNAESLIEKSVGFVNTGEISIDTAFLRSKLEYETTIQPKLSLEIDADFSAAMKLCMRLSQPDSILRHKITNTENIIDSEYQLKITKNKTLKIPGKTYSLNRKNNEMCSALFSS